MKELELKDVPKELYVVIDALGEDEDFGGEHFYYCVGSSPRTALRHNEGDEERTLYVYKLVGRRTGRLKAELWKYEDV